MISHFRTDDTPPHKCSNKKSPTNWMFICDLTIMSCSGGASPGVDVCNPNCVLCG